MKIILLQDVPNLGSKDQVLVVKDGYGRNYLIPQKKAQLASESALKVLAENLKQRAHKEAKIKEEATKVAAKLEGVKLVLGAKTSSTGKIFGSVNTIQLAEALEKQGYTIDRRTITINNEDSIKEIGSYTANIKLHREVSVKIEFEVVSE